MFRRVGTVVGGGKTFRIFGHNCRSTDITPKTSRIIRVIQPSRRPDYPYRAATAKSLGLLASASWTNLLAGGFTIYFFAQAALFILTLGSGGNPPFPSFSDLGFFVSEILLITGVALAIRAWLKLDLFPEGERRAAIAGVTAAIPLALGIALTVRTLARASAPPLQVAADITYPILNSSLLILTIAMLRLTMLLGKGSVGIVWRSLLAGFLAMAIGDVVYSFFAGFNLDSLHPVLDVLYTVAYASMARGALLQFQLLRD